MFGYFDVDGDEQDLIVRFSTDTLGEVAAVEVTAELTEMVERAGCRSLILDFTSVQRVSSAMLAKTIRLKRTMDAQGGRLQLIRLSPRIRQAFRVTKLDQLLDITPGEPDVQCTI